MNFTFCGMNTADVGQTYAPDAADIFVWNTDYNTHSIEVDGHDGGYWFGTTINPKVFTLDCFFEQQSDLQLKQMEWLFSRGKTGELIFEDRPFLTYIGTVTKIKKFEIYAGNSGKITVEITAYYPFAKMDSLSVTSYAQYGPSLVGLLKGTTGILTTAMTPDTAITSGLNATKSFLLYNPGDELADVRIKIAGDVGTGVSIYNNRTKQTCVITGLTKVVSGNVGKWLEVNATTGNIYLTNGETYSSGALYHDRGFIQLEGSAPIARDISVTYDGNLVSSNGAFRSYMEGQYIYINGYWRRIDTFLSPSEIIIGYVYGGTGASLSTIAIMNYITVTPLTTMSLTQLEFVYYPTFK